MVVRTHLTNVHGIWRIQYDQKKAHLPHWKPVGLWYSIDHAWLEWCVDNMPERAACRYEHELELDMRRILRIYSDETIEHFTHTYGVPLVPGATKYIGMTTGIDWARVIERYDGMEIHPYSWNAHIQHIWYNTWDVMGGVIWNLNALRSWKRRLSNFQLWREERAHD